MPGLETGVGAVTETYSSLEKVGQHDCGGPGDDLESSPRLGRDTTVAKKHTLVVMLECVDCKMCCGYGSVDV